MTLELLMRLLTYSGIFAAGLLLGWFFSDSKAETVPSSYLNPPSKPKEAGPKINIPRFLSAIKAVEGTPRKGIGRSGERSEYQITEATWTQHSTRIFSWASETNPICEDELNSVVMAHYVWLKRNIEKTGKHATVFNLASCWHGGFERWRSLQSRTEDVEYAKRVDNVYESTQ